MAAHSDPYSAPRIALTSPLGMVVHVGPVYISIENMSWLFGAHAPVLMKRFVDASGEEDMDVIDLDGAFDPFTLDPLAPLGTYVVVDEALADNDDLPEPVPEALELARREFIARTYQPLYPELWTFNVDWLAPALREALAHHASTGDESLLRTLMTLETETGVFGLPVFTAEFCAALIGELRHFEASGLPCIRPNSMNRFGAVLDDIGMGDMLQALMHTVVSPMAAFVYPAYGGASLDTHHGFVVAYRLGEDIELGFHYDAAEVTLNVCLGETFAGGALYFRGLLGDPATHDEHATIEHVPGRGLLHVGCHRHGAMPITGGERFNLILWCKSSSQPTCGCGHASH